MDPNLFNVIFTGRLLDGFTTDEVIKSFANKFKIPEVKAQKVITANKEVVLKPRAEHVKAYKFKSALEELGMEVRLERAAMAAPKPEPVQAAKEEPAKVSNEQTKAVPQNPQPQANGNASWSLEPIAKEPEAEEVEQPTQTSPAYQPKTQAQESQHEPTQTKVSAEPGRTVGDLIKTIGGLVVAGIGILFIAVKKFGLFKVLKIGGLMTAAAFAGYNPEEVCMGNGLCEDAIDEQIDDCWEQSGMDAYDWDNMPVDQYLSLKPKIENDFVACFVYEDTGQRVLESPLEVRFDLIDNCYETYNEDCISLAESQLKSCYAANDIDALVSKESMDFYQAVYDYPKAFKNYYGCFVDASGNPLFSEVLQYWDEIYNSDYY